MKHYILLGLFVLGCVSAAPLELPSVPVPIPAVANVHSVDVSAARRLDLTVLSWVSRPDATGKAKLRQEPTEIAGGCVVAFVRNGWVYGVTAEHCVRAEMLTMRVAGNDVEVVERSVPADLAVIRWRATPGEVYTPARWANPVLGSRVVNTAWLEWQFNIHTRRVSRHLGPGNVSLIEDGWVGITCPTRVGCSGSPVFDMDGAVVGIVSRRAAGCDSFGYAADGREAQKLLATVPADK
ncbi:MAG TPA: serine protease [Phycisphaerae bacterium]|nr:serine protease [Phycisphaerae bacterium]